MVGHRKKQTSRGPKFLLVAEPDRFLSFARLWCFAPGFGLYFCLSVYLDSLHSQFDHQLSRRWTQIALSSLPHRLRFECEILFHLRGQIGWADRPRDVSTADCAELELGFGR